MRTKRRHAFALMAGTMGLTLCLALVGCGGGSTSSGGSGGSDEVVEEEIVDEVGDEEEIVDEVVEEDVVEIAANVHPEDIDPGSLDQENTSDLWWPNGVQSGEAVYFTRAANDAGKTVSFFVSDEEYDDIWEVELTDDGHLVSGADADRQFDIVFIDNFTCYDYATETLYRRGTMSQADYEALLVGTYAYNPDDLDEDTFDLQEGGVLIQTFDGKQYEGTWSVINTTEVLFDFGTYDDDYDFVMENGEVTAIMDGSSPFVKVA